MPNIQVQVGTSTNRNTILIDDGETLKTAFERQRISLNGASVYLDGATIQAGDLNKTFSALGCKDTAILTAIAKLDNAT